MKKIKIMHIQLLPLLSGVQNMMLHLLSGLDQEQYEIYVLSRADGPLVDKVKANGWVHLPIHHFERELSWHDVHVARQLVQILKQTKPDIVHTHSSKPGFLGRIIARLVGVPLVVHTIHGFPFHPYQNMWKRFFYQRLEMLAAEFAHYNVFCNNYEREYAIKRLRFQKSKAVTVYNAPTCLMEDGEWKMENREAQRHEAPPSPPRSQAHGGGHPELQIVSVSRFSEQKNIIFTIAQAIRVVRRFPQVNFTFFGDGELFLQCEKLVTKHQAEEKIMLKGWSTNVLAELPHYDLFLLNSLWEGLSISILEAMSRGLPIICSDIKGNNELVDTTNGWLINPLDPNGISDVVQTILGDISVLLEKGKNSIIKVTKQFNRELFIQGYLKIYAESPPLPPPLK